MESKIKIKEFESFNLENGYLIDGFPSAGFSSAIASESMIKTSQFKLAGIIDADSFPPISVIKDGKPNYPSRIFVNDELKVAIFLSYLTLDQSLHKITAKTMLEWAEERGMLTGLVATSTVTHATPASFAAHIDFTNNANTLGWQMGTNQTF